MFSPGTIVRSRDPRDDAEMFYVVIEGTIRHRTGMCSLIAEMGQEEVEVYRLDRFLVDASAEVAEHVRVAEEHAKDIREGR